MSSVVVVSSENLDEKQQSVSTSVVQGTDKKVNLLGMSRAELEQFFEKIGEKKFRAGQVMKWIHQYFVTDFAEMNAVWDSWVPQGHAPARATGEAKLAAPGYLVEVIVTAALK